MAQRVKGQGANCVRKPTDHNALTERVLQNEVGKWREQVQNTVVVRTKD